jgi:hypothetical protein
MDLYGIPKMLTGAKVAFRVIHTISHALWVRALPSFRHAMTDEPHGTPRAGGARRRRTTVALGITIIIFASMAAFSEFFTGRAGARLRFPDPSSAAGDDAGMQVSR